MVQTATPTLVRDAAPYFDGLVACLEEREPLTTTAFGRHVHWGYWTDPAAADGTPSDYAWAAEQLCRRVCDAAGVRDGLRILDVGCGFGGTIASLNERFNNLDMVGVNIDGRQLDRAAREVRPMHGNRVRFMEADALRLGFEVGSFDIVLAVECVFHFGDRTRFFAEVRRVLTPGGRFALSDFVPPEKALAILRSYDPAKDEAMRQAYGKIDVSCTLEAYRQIAKDAGFRVTTAEPITRHTMPTYKFLQKSAPVWGAHADVSGFRKATGQLETACRLGLLDYMILGFSKAA